MIEFDQIKAIREEYCGLKDFPRKSLANSVKTLADDLYAKDTHFIFELIQNAEDNDYRPKIQPRLRFEISQQEVEGDREFVLSVHNNEVGFQEMHVRAICLVGQSTKNKAQGYIGEKGIGFKSVFRITNSPYVFSNGFRFCLPERDEETGLGYIVPRWVEKSPAALSEQETTIILPLNKSPKDVQSVSKALREIAPETILFLKKLTSLEIFIRLPEEEYEVVAEKRILRESGASKLVELSYMQRGGELEEDVVETAQYWLTEQEFQKPSEIQHEKRLNIETRTVSIAIPLDQDVHAGKLFAYLPVWENTGLPFLVNADFLLVSSREGIRENEEWNLWLRDCVAETYTAAFLELLADKQLSLATKVSAYASIPLETHSQFLESIVETVEERLADLDCVLTLPDLVPVKPEQARLCQKNLRKVFGPPENFPLYLREKARPVCQEVEPFDKQLLTIGVKRFLPSDLTSALGDSTWVQSHPFPWFIDLFRYLKTQKFDSDSLQNLHIIPIDQGKRKTHRFSCAAEQPIYFAADPEGHKALANIPSRFSSFIVVAFIHRDFQAQLDHHVDCEDLKEWLTKYLSIYPFSIANYCVDILGTISSEYEDFSAEELVEATRFLFQNADKKTFNWDTLPVVLADGRKMLMKDVRKLTIADSVERIQAVVVPENYDPKAGWQHIWKIPLDRAHFVVLAGQYASMPKEWFSFLEIKHYPMFREIKWMWWQVPKGLSYWEERYLADRCYQMAAQSRAGETAVSSYEIPNGFAGEKCSKDISNSLLEFFKTQNKTNCRFDAKGSYENRGRYRPCSASSLLKKIRSIPWLPTTKGLVAPKEAFLPKPGIKEVLGNTVPYFEGEFPEHVLELLEVQSEVSIGKLIGVLENNSGRKIGLELPRRIYKELANRSSSDEVTRKFFQSAFTSTALICGTTGPGGVMWHKREECIWEDASDIIGNDFVYLGSQYPNLKDFFVKIVGVKERLDAENFARRLLVLQDAPLADLKQQRYLVEKIYRELKPITSKPEQERPVWWKDFAKKVKLYSKSDKFCEPDALILPDDGELRRIFEKHDVVEFAWRPGDDAFNDWVPFYRTFNVPLLSESITESLEECASPKFLEKNRFVTVAAVQMIAAWLRENKRADYDRLLSSEIFQQLLSLREATTEEMIRVEYRLETDSYDYDSRSEDYPVFWDASNNILYYTGSPGKAPLAKVLAKNLLVDYKNLAHWIELVLEAADTARLKDENWSVPREISAMCGQEVASIPQQITDDSPSPIECDDSDQNLEEVSANSTLPTEPASEVSRPQLPIISPTESKPTNRIPGSNAAANIILPAPKEEASAEEENDQTDNELLDEDRGDDGRQPNSQGGQGKPSHVNFSDEIRKSFNKDGATKINDELAKYGESCVKNPDFRGQKISDNFRDAIENEPSPEGRRRPREGSTIEVPSEEVRSSLFEYYRGKCQICGKTWPKRNGEPFFVAAYLVHRRHARWLDNPGNALCLCAEHFAQWRYAAKEHPEDITTQIGKLRLKAEGGDGNLSIHFKMLNDSCAICYEERHFLELRTLLVLTKEMETVHTASN